MSKVSFPSLMSKMQAQDLEARADAFNEVENALYQLLNMEGFANLPEDDNEANDLAVQIDRVRMLADQYFQQALVDAERFGVDKIVESKEAAKELLQIQSEWIKERMNGSV